MPIIISDVNEGPVVNVAAWLGTIVMVFGVCTRIWSKYSILRKWTLDDALIVVTMCLGCIVTATISMAVANGLGQPQSSLSGHQIVEFQKLLYMPALCLAKMTTLVYLRALTPDSRFGMINMWLEIFVIIWGLAAELAIAFQCRLPSPWAIISGKCFDTAVFWEANGTIDVLTDIIIALLPLYLVWSLQMPWKRKSVVIMAFGSRILIIPLTGWRIYSLSTMSGQDLTLSLYYGYLTTTIQLNSAIFMTCVAFLRPFLQTMVSGGMATTVQSTNPSYEKNSTRFTSYLSSLSGGRTSTVKQSYKMENLSEEGLFESTVGESESNTNGSYTNFFSHNNDDIHFAPAKMTNLEDLGPLRPDKVLSFSRVSNPPPEEENAPSAGSKAMAITRTMEWGVQEEIRRAKLRGGDHEP